MLSEVRGKERHKEEIFDTMKQYKTDDKYDNQDGRQPGWLVFCSLLCFGRRSSLMVSVLNSGSSGPGSGPDRGHCVVFLGKTLYSHGVSLNPGV